MRLVSALGAVWVIALASCAKTPLPEPFGVTMVEETTCNGMGGRITMGPDGAFCAMGR
ncbi:hypothetical protein SAMN05444287_0510 [Octadecabacter temperatus]|uniref:Uncharacterized protein n=1 Tax=Octadecabacter temperatus TaxID=1458307 RepID=A0A0K0Y3F9_9RHOB|nr:hypothetical protein OSB_08570 [Octadecabacter temperatus]SIN92444.1 hypothetical protein SAMN05444287_0510 [Octadecabacter temperatus]